MAEGLDTSVYPPMGSELVAPVVGWLSHESCSITGEMIVSMAGRVAKAYVAETQGLYRPSWTIEDVPANLDTIRDTTDACIFPPVPTGHVDHLKYSFAMATKR